MNTGTALRCQRLMILRRLLTVIRNAGKFLSSIYVRSCLLAFDDNTKAFNQYAAAFREIDINNVVAHMDGSLRQRPVASIDLSCFSLGSKSKLHALEPHRLKRRLLVRDYRGEDSLGKAFLIIYEMSLLTVCLKPIPTS